MNKKDAIIKIEHVYKYFGQFLALEDINLDVFKQEKIVIIGPSGSGKSTLLRTINQLEKVTSGKIIVDGVDVTEPGVDLNKIRTSLGMVFQSFNLFPHKTVLENLTLAPIKLKKLSKEEAEEIALNLLDKVGIKDKANNYPKQLSGGQQQRVAIARALAMATLCCCPPESCFG